MANQPKKKKATEKKPSTAKSALANMKTEVAGELGLSNYEKMDKGNLTARQNGSVGGYMTKKLVQMAENQLTSKK